MDVGSVFRKRDFTMKQMLLLILLAGSFSGLSAYATERRQTASQEACNKTAIIMAKITGGMIAFVHAALTGVQNEPTRADLIPVPPVASFGIGATLFLSAGYDLISVCLPEK